MVGQGDLSQEAFSYLLDCRGECEWLDYKESLQLESDYQQCAFARDILAMKNVGGGYIVVGVKDKSWEQVGLSQPFTYDTKLLREKVLRATGASLEIDVVQHTRTLGNATKYFPVILVRASRKRSKRRMPTLVKNDFCSGQAFGLRRGEIYVRDGDSTVRVNNQEQLFELLARLEDSSDAQSLIAAEPPSPFAVDEGTFRLLERGYSNFVGRHELRKAVLEAIQGDPRMWIINIHGPGGVGKSALVNWVTYELFRLGDFEAILQLTAKETILTDSGIARYSRSLYSLENLIDHILSLFLEEVGDDPSERRAAALECLRAWKTLVVLDNMETVSDGRILSFVRDISPDSKSRVVLTSRQRTGGWENAISVGELSDSEMLEFVMLKSDELEVAFPTDPKILVELKEVTGGLPLAAQWIIGQYKRTKDIGGALRSAQARESPVLEFSFRNIWSVLSHEARAVLALMTIFDGPVEIREMALASEMPADRVERAFVELADVTLVERRLHGTEGREVFTALPITLNFARHQLSEMGETELRARRRLNEFHEQMELQASEVARFGSEFARYGLETPNEKRAAIMCRRAESEMFSGNAETAEVLLAEARGLAPQSAYVHAKSASYELARNRVGLALQRIDEACKRATRKTGGLCYTIKARILDVQRDRGGRIEALAKVLEFEPEDTVARHQYGVALSRMGLAKEAVEQFTRIVEVERQRVPPRETLVMALTTRAINNHRLGARQEVQMDLASARDLVARYGHLRSAAGRLDDIEADLAE